MNNVRHENLPAPQLTNSQTSRRRILFFDVPLQSGNGNTSTGRIDSHRTKFTVIQTVATRQAR
ncbi:hypothetical protein, partial [Fischerella thermalis]